MKLNPPPDQPDTSTLYLPPADKLNVSELRGYLTFPEKEILDVPLADKRDAINWLMNDRHDNIKEFDLSGQKDLYTALKMDGLNELLKNSKLQNVELLRLDDCGLRSLPELGHLYKLNILKVTNNEISSIHTKNVQKSSIHTLFIEGNPIGTFHFEYKDFPRLIKVTCGSKVTKEISRPVLERINKGNLQVYIPSQDNQTALKTPPFNVLDDGKLLENYLHKRDVDISSRAYDHVSVKDVKSMITDKTKVLKLSGRANLFKTKDMLVKFLKSKRLTGIEELYMDKCFLTEVPDVRHLQNLIHLDVSNNSVPNSYLKTTLDLPFLKNLNLRNTNLYWLPSLTYLPRLKHLDFSKNQLSEKYMGYVFNEQQSKPHPLETLDLSSNDVEKIIVNRISFPSLKKLTCGSIKTRYISFELVEAHSKSQMVINVPKVFQKYLLVPAPSVLDDSSNSLAYMKDTSIELKRIMDTQSKLNAFQWIMEERKGFYKTLILTDQGHFCADKALSSLLKLSSTYTVSVTCLYLDNCGLKSIPLEKGYLPSLKYLNVRRNNITELKFVPHPKLEKLIVDENSIETIQISNVTKNYPSLKFVQAGSVYTKNIEIPLLEAVADPKNSLTINIISEYRQHLEQPPYEVLKGGYSALNVYIKEMSVSKKNHSDILRSTTQNILLFLGNRGPSKMNMRNILEKKILTGAQQNVSAERFSLNVGNGVTLPALDYGDFNIYEVEFDLLRGQNIVALISVDIVAYSEEKHYDLVTKWLLNCVLCANCRVIFVPTTTEPLLPLKVNEKEQWMRLLISEWLKAKIDFLQKTRQSIHENDENKLDLEEVDRSVAYFKNFEIIMVPTNSTKMIGIDKLKTKIRDMVKFDQVRFPSNWNRILNFVTDSKTNFKYHVSFTDIKDHIIKVLNDESEEAGGFRKVLRKVGNTVSIFLPGSTETHVTVDESVEECLRYLHKKRVLLWYDGNKEYVYHNINNILEVYTEIFKLDLDESRLDYEHYMEDIRSAKENFRSAGLLSRDVLQCLLSPIGLAPEELEGMIELLRSSNCCFMERYKERGTSLTPGYPSLKFPMYIKNADLNRSFWEHEWPSKIPNEYLEFTYLYTFCEELPSTLFERISVRLQYVLNNYPESRRLDWTNGMYARMENVKILIQRQKTTTPRLVVKLRAESGGIFDLWKFSLDIYDQVVNKLVEQNDIMTYNKAYICPHCILTGRSVESAYQIPLGEVMRSRCDDQYDLSCQNADISGKQQSVVPAAFLRPLIKGESYK